MLGAGWLCSLVVGLVVSLAVMWVAEGTAMTLAIITGSASQFERDVVERIDQYDEDYCRESFEKFD